MRKWLLSPWTAILTLFLVLGLRIADPSFIESVRLRYFDTLITAKPITENNIFVINIDDAAIEKHGQWPFDRRVYASLIEELYKRNAGLVVFNVLMPENDRQGGDSELARILAQHPVVLNNVPSSANKNTAKKPGAAILNPDYINTIVNYPGIIANIPALEVPAAGVGITNTLPEIDGVNRRLPLIVSSGGNLYPSVALETLRVAAGDSTFQVKLFENGVEKMRIPAFGAITTDNLGRIWIDWSQGLDKTSMMHLPEDFGGAVVIVGPTATGVANPVATARGAVFPHEIHAIAIATLANNVNIERPDYADGVEMLAILIAGIILLFLTRWVYVGLAAAISIGIAGIIGSRLIFDGFLLLFDATMFTVAIVLVALHAYGIKFVSEFLQKQAIKKQFAGYASPTVVRLLQEDPDLIKKGRKVPVSICFSDLRGFTPLGESFGKDVKGLTDVMNGYMDCISQPILDSNGMIIKYIGDATMHIHNAPIEDPDHPKTVVRVALQMVKAVKEYSKKLEAMGRPGVKMGAGINSGEGYVGEMGSKQRHSYDILGDDVSTCARIESKCKEYGCILLVGENTVNQCRDEFFFLKIDDLAVKGKTVGIRIYTVLDDVKPAYEYSRGRHNRMHDSYLQQDFKEAIKLCQQLKGHFDGKMDDYYDMWTERCEYMLTQDLPKDWNGVFIATTK